MYSDYSKGMVEALIGAVDHSVALTEKHGSPSNERLLSFTRNLRKVIHKLMVTGQGTRDICGPSGLTTGMQSVTRWTYDHAQNTSSRRLGKS